MLGADRRAFMTDNLAVSINKILQDLHLLIINLFEIIGAKITLFGIHGFNLRLVKFFFFASAPHGRRIAIKQLWIPASVGMTTPVCS